MAKDAGYLQYEGLPGSIHTGCINTPAHNSRFCKHHGECICSLKVASDEEVNEVDGTTEEISLGPLTRARAKAQGLNIIENVAVIEKVLDKKLTRNKTYYKVWAQNMFCLQWLLKKMCQGYNVHCLVTA